MLEWMRRSLHSTLEQHFLNSPIAARKGVIELDAVANSFGGEAMMRIDGHN
ncbi:MAG: hypothetical protein KME45_09100 [Stenomitos rutilans HA7619-LM2]|jgi:hypothetical protein|nr:hypothetical protein [Stenomitos rutilans HA7619-LM2]